MPKESVEYYRFIKTYTREQTKHPRFEHFRDLDLSDMKLPKDCEGGIIYNYFSHENDQGNIDFYHFESEDEMMGYKAAVYDDPSIYHEWRSGRKEYRELQKYKEQSR